MKKTKNTFQWNKVTPLSKYLAMILFITLPVFGFYFGTFYQKINTVTEKSDTTLSYKLPIGWKIFKGSDIPEIGYDPKKMTANAVTDSGTGIVLTYGKTGELYVFRYGFGLNPQYRNVTSPKLLLEGSLSNYVVNKINPKNVAEGTILKEYVVDNHPAYFYYGVDENYGEVVGMISLDSKADFLQFISSGFPYSELEKILGTIETDWDNLD
jgi:hypothetical protein